MAKRPAAEQLAIRLYASGKSMEEISRELEVSQTTLYKWKAESKTPGLPMDDWDAARQKKADNLTRLTVLFERQMEFIETLDPGEITAPMIDALSKLGALVGKWKQTEEVIRSATRVIDETVKQGGLSDDAADLIRKQILGLNQ